MSDPDEPQWLTEDEQVVWQAFSSVLLRLPSALDTRMRDAAGISQFDYNTLAAVCMTREHRIRMSELAERTASTLSRLSNVVSRLEKRGWLRRETDTDDARTTVVVLTDDGFTKVKDSSTAHVEHIRQLVLDPLTNTQLSQLERIARRITAAIDTTAPDR